MKKLQLLLVALFLTLGANMAKAEFRIGPRVGIAVNSLKFSSDIWESSNRTGFTGGLQFEFIAPIVNLGFDASVMYVRRDERFIEESTANHFSASKDWIEVPVNLKYKLGLPLIDKVVSPYVFTGPSFAFLTSGRAISNAWHNKKYDVSWNFGLGLQFFKHLQIGASYGVGMTKVARFTGVAGPQSANIKGRNNFWTATAAWLF